MFLDSGADVACSPQMVYWDVTLGSIVVAISDVCALSFDVLLCVIRFDLLFCVLMYCNEIMCFVVMLVCCSFFVICSVCVCDVLLWDAWCVCVIIGG